MSSGAIPCLPGLERSSQGRLGSPLLLLVCQRGKSANRGLGWNCSDMEKKESMDRVGDRLPSVPVPHLTLWDSFHYHPNNSSHFLPVLDDTLFLRVYDISFPISSLVFLPCLPSFLPLSFSFFLFLCFFVSFSLSFLPSFLSPSFPPFLLSPSLSLSFSL